MATVGTDFVPTTAGPLAKVPGRAERVHVAIWPIVLVMYATLLPREIRMEVGDLNFFPDRIALILVVPWIMRHIFLGAIRLVLPDLLVIFVTVWQVAAMVENLGWARGLPNGGSVSLDIGAGYFLARISFRSPDDIRRGLILLAPGLALVGAILVVESISHRLIARPFAVSIFGPVLLSGGADFAVDRLAAGQRLGLTRAYGPFPHPILGGLQMATLLPLYWFAGIRGWPKVIGILSSITAFFTVSSAAIIALILGAAFLVYDALTRTVRELTWPLAISIIAAACLLAQVATESGVIGLIVRFATFDQFTGYFRVLIWEFGSASVAKYPWFGIGLRDYERPLWMFTSSVDNHWLLWAMRYGLPSALALLAACGLALLALGRSASAAAKVDAEFYRGVAICLAIFVLLMWTVTLQGGPLTWFMLLLGAAVACAQRADGRSLVR